MSLHACITTRFWTHPFQDGVRNESASWTRTKYLLDQYNRFCALSSTGLFCRSSSLYLYYLNISIVRMLTMTGDFSITPDCDWWMWHDRWLWLVDVAWQMTMIGGCGMTDDCDWWMWHDRWLWLVDVAWQMTVIGGCGMTWLWLVNVAWQMAVIGGCGMTDDCDWWMWHDRWLWLVDVAWQMTVIGGCGMTDDCDWWMWHDRWLWLVDVAWQMTVIVLLFLVSACGLPRRLASLHTAGIPGVSAGGQSPAHQVQPGEDSAHRPRAGGVRPHLPGSARHGEPPQTANHPRHPPTQGRRTPRRHGDRSAAAPAWMLLWICFIIALTWLSPSQTFPVVCQVLYELICRDEEPEIH